jgi:hypothetical protein
MRLDKVKRPARVSSFEFHALDEDSHGVWLFAPVGSTWVTPDDNGALPIEGGDDCSRDAESARTAHRALG